MGPSGTHIQGMHDYMGQWGGGRVNKKWLLKERQMVKLNKWKKMNGAKELKERA